MYTLEEYIIYQSKENVKKDHIYLIPRVTTR